MRAMGKIFQAKAETAGCVLFQELADMMGGSRGVSGCHCALS